MVQKVALNNVRFRSFHGLYPEERVLGNDFIINVKLSSSSENKEEAFIDYTLVYEIVEDVMAKREDLLETVVLEIVSRFKQKFSSITYLFVSLQKLNPPFGGRCDSAELTVEETFE